MSSRADRTSVPVAVRPALEWRGLGSRVIPSRRCGPPQPPPIHVAACFSLAARRPRVSDATDYGLKPPRRTTSASSGADEGEEARGRGARAVPHLGAASHPPHDLVAYEDAVVALDDYLRRRRRAAAALTPRDVQTFLATGGRAGSMHRSRRGASALRCVSSCAGSCAMSVPAGAGDRRGRSEGDPRDRARGARDGDTCRNRGAEPDGGRRAGPRWLLDRRTA